MRFITAVFIFSILWFFTVIFLGRYVLTGYPDHVYSDVYIWGTIFYSIVLTINRLKHRSK